MRLPRLLFVDRQQQALIVAALVVGTITGALVAAFEQVTANWMLAAVLDAPLWVVVAAPALGLAVAAAARRFLSDSASPTTSDAYIENFHDRMQPLPQRPVLGRIIASMATLGSGGAMGFEGPAMYIGAAVGSTIQQKFRRYFHSSDVKVLMIAGVAGGVAAIFKAPATGVLFALESPYQEDLARLGLLPSLVAAAASYLTFVALLGTEPILDFATAGTGFSWIEILGAVVVGVLAGVGARAYSWAMRHAKRLRRETTILWRLLFFGGALALLAVGSYLLFGDALSVGAGYTTLTWTTDPQRAIGLIVALFLFRFLATTFTVAGGGSGGMFIPLVVLGSVLGRFVYALFDAAGWEAASSPATAVSLFTILGIAAFLGAGYRTPLTAVMFVAESTGKAVFVVPGLIAAAISQLFMGNSSVSPMQRNRRSSHLERRFKLPITSALLTDVHSVPADTTMSEFVANYVVLTRQRIGPVIDDGKYLGMCVLRDVAAVPSQEWSDRLVTEVMRTDLPLARLDWTLRDAVVAMNSVGFDRLAVADDNDLFVGEIRRDEILNLDGILGDTAT